MPRREGQTAAIISVDGNSARGARIAAGLTQRELAKVADISVNSIYNIEHEVGRVGELIFHNLVNALGVQKESLLRKEPLPNTVFEYTRLKFTGINLSRATQAQLLRELELSRAYTNRIVSILEGKA